MRVSGKKTDATIIEKRGWIRVMGLHGYNSCLVLMGAARIFAPTGQATIVQPYKNILDLPALPDWHEYENRGRWLYPRDPVVCAAFPSPIALPK